MWYILFHFRTWWRWKRLYSDLLQLEYQIEDSRLPDKTWIRLEWRKLVREAKEMGIPVKERIAELEIRRHAIASRL